MGKKQTTKGRRRYAVENNYNDNDTDAKANKDCLTQTGSRLFRLCETNSDALSMAGI